MLVNHAQGQRRAELFEEAIALILPVLFLDSDILRDFIVPKQSGFSSLPDFTADFAVLQSDSSLVLVEAKAPYTEKALDGLDRTIRRLKRSVETLPKSVKVTKIVLAVASKLSISARDSLTAAVTAFKKKNIKLEIWDLPKLADLFRKNFQQILPTFSTEELEHFLRVRGASSSPVEIEEVERKTSHLNLDLETPTQTIVMSADICSYSSFVHASHDDQQLAVAIMGRFYRESRKIVTECGGVIDKFIGDGLLIFWSTHRFPKESLTKLVEECARQLIGMSLRLAKEWQEQIDLAIHPIGMRIGAAIGSLLYIPESSEPGAPVHAIGEAINLAVRLARQSPNSFTVSNRLKQSVFSEDSTFRECKATDLKNILGSIRYWEKDFSEATTQNSLSE